MSDVSATKDLPAPPERVWAVVMDPHRLEDWVTIHKRLTRADDGEPRVGFEMGQRMVIRGAPVSISWTIDELDAPTHAVWKGTGPARSSAHIVYELEDLGGDRTRFHYTNAFEAPMGVVGRVAAKALMGGVPQREADASLDALASLLEREG